MLSGKPRFTQNLDVFGGYNHNLRIQEGEFYEMENMTSDHYPILAPRSQRGIYALTDAACAMISKDALCYVDGGDFVINQYHVKMGLSTLESDCPKQLVSMGAYVIILPDKKYINTADLADFGNIEAAVTTSEPVTFSLCREDGAEYAPDYTQPGEPTEPENMQLWMDTSAAPSSLKQWSSASAMWVSVTDTCVKLSSPGIGKPFQQYDGVFIRGLSGDLTDSVSGAPLTDSTELAALEGTAVILAGGDDYIVITGMLEGTRTISEPVTVEREMPEMDFVIERENRLWGCRYGLNRDGEVVNEIYASKLGDFRNWNCFQGISTDSYAVSVGSDGPFTGAVTYGGYPLFFKENCVHKIFGDYPANFGIQTTACRGVERGSEKSLAIVDGLLYYKAGQGVCVYDGSLPAEISQSLGQSRYTNATAGVHGHKYYISMTDTAGSCHLFVYDTVKGLWHREDELAVQAFCSCEGCLYCLEQGGKRILALAGAAAQSSEQVSWMVQTGPLGMTLLEKKYVSRLTLRLSMEQGACVRVWIQYDSLGGWEHCGAIQARQLGSFALAIRPRRCDHFRLKIEGEGQARIYCLNKTISQGSDRT